MRDRRPRKSFVSIKGAMDDLTITKSSILEKAAHNIKEYLELAAGERATSEIHANTNVLLNEFTDKEKFEIMLKVAVELAEENS